MKVFNKYDTYYNKEIFLLIKKYYKSGTKGPICCSVCDFCPLHIINNIYHIDSCLYVVLFPRGKEEKTTRIKVGIILKELEKIYKTEPVQEEMDI